ncbi:tRNA (N6-isopentenyl adenosine(37)-C2)-methylthiotransferase MiaB [Candidatus Berkelbacteria bacterium CG10_big_fil_rev_8_21_14_0_10_41_12]|uniref:tRNA (N6-isopentenyl adenosine(37)-C2)-methylthiotransferase MiaB n=1 Tax=Candidatus Berkelbacteria bacterium CG10_big_fil_rev_8_21_14_0_10_41_12 TaxID=1974513 RepID=A0A2M6WY08_9BACT|nr:MAG: tRNA (N6-isopentenyl adenosine(37)-C2)-methylthiotransferase MiaB [Candidatus Berkelbacteria bacterium CG10_big_fil_rev_8_21_14_0_10_41_12]
MDLNYWILTLGCQQNKYDSAKLEKVLKDLGFKKTGENSAQYIFVVACAVRQTAVDRLMGRINKWKGKEIFILGCVIEADKRKFKKSNIRVLDSFDKKTLSKILNRQSQTLRNDKPKTHFLPIMNGCNNFCSYCAVPYTRGREISRPMNEIIKEAKQIIDAGHKEITLLGQNVNSYNQSEKIKDKSKKKDFATLLKKLNSLKGNFMVSFISNHPKDMTDDIIEAVATLPKIKKEIHLPLQSGSDKILKLMNRPYTIKQYLEIVDKIRKANPKIKITTDVIVGFPGEDEKEFQDTLGVFKKVGYRMAYINKYSPRAGTAAYKLGDPISWKEKQRRWHKLNKILSFTRR